MEKAEKTLSRIARGEDRVAQLISESLAIEADQAKDAGALGFMARALVQATMPHSKPAECYFERKNGDFTLTMMAPPKVGLPYGNIPRLLMAWLTTEAVRTKSRELVLGDSLSSFMRELGLVPTGGRWGSITRLRAQSHRLFTTTVSCVYERHGGNMTAELGFRLADKHVLWWDPKSPEQTNLFSSVVTLSQPFFEEVTLHPVPIDMRALRFLKRSPLAIDIYVWLTYRLSYLRTETTIPWPALQSQFGADYRRTIDFRISFTEHLKEVLAIYRNARALPSDAGLKLRPSPTHVPRIAI